MHTYLHIYMLIEGHTDIQTETPKHAYNNILQHNTIEESTEWEYNTTQYSTVHCSNNDAAADDDSGGRGEGGDDEDDDVAAGDDGRRGDGDGADNGHNGDVDGDDAGEGDVADADDDDDVPDGEHQHERCGC